jgi:polyphenol oxidase
MAEESDINTFAPSLERRSSPGGVHVWTDPRLSRSGVIVAFSERGGGVSSAPFDSLDLAAHVGDDPDAVDANRTLFLDALGVADMRPDLVTAEQVHGGGITAVTRDHAGAGAYARGVPPIPATDALLTEVASLPLLMLYADCVPVVLVALRPRRAVCVVHAGWRGSLSRLPAAAAGALAGRAGCSTSDLHAYIGPHIGRCCYEVGEDILSQFCNTFDTIGAVDGRLDLTAAVYESITGSGVPRDHIADVGVCTRDHADRFFSYRAAPVTGRHGALAVITEGE